MAAPGVVPASRVAMDTSSLLIAFGPPLTFKAPVPKLIISDEFNLQLASIFLVRVCRNILIPSVRMTLTMSKIFARIICQTYYILVRRFVQFSHSCSFCIRRYSHCCTPVKPGYYSVLRPRILRVLLTLYGKMT